MNTTLAKHFLHLIIGVAVIYLPTDQLFGQAGGSWVKMTNFGGGGTYAATGFSIGKKGYLGTGFDVSFNARGDFWEWDETTNVWTQKADFAGGAPSYQRGFAIGFSIGSKGYVGTGSSVLLDNQGNVISHELNNRDFWEYDPVMNSWTRKADLPALGRNHALGFSIANKGYIALGNYSVPTPPYNDIGLTDLWEYDPATDSWISKANFPGTPRRNAMGFSIGNRGYVGTGMDTAMKILKDFWEWDQLTDKWTQKADFGGGPRNQAFGYSIGSYGYAGMGETKFGPAYQPKDLWQYRPYFDTWTQVAPCPGGQRSFPVAFSIGCKGYYGTGAIDSAGKLGQSDFWKHIPDTLVAAIAGITTICAGSSTYLSASGGEHYTWSTGDTISFIAIIPSVTTTYTVSVSDVCGADTKDVTVQVNQHPMASVTYQTDQCSQGKVVFTDHSANITSIMWKFGDGTSGSTINPVHVYSPGTYSVTLMLGALKLCKDTSMSLPVDVPRFSELYIPNAFSPNGDLNNDMYYILGDCITEMKLIIYDRWGEKIFETTDRNMGWDGTYKGEKLNSGVFMYYFEGTLTTGEQINKSGNITLMR